VLTAVIGLPSARPLPDPAGYGTVPLAGFRVSTLPGSAAEAEERQAEAVTRRAIPALRRVGRYRLESTQMRAPGGYPPSEQAADPAAPA
jgi:hypothetical protein